MGPPQNLAKSGTPCAKGSGLDADDLEARAVARKPIELDEARRRRLLEALQAGATIRMASAAAGVSEDTLSRWRKAKPDLEADMQQAEAAGAVRALQVIQAAAASGTWQAAAWMLERRYPGEYGRRAPRVDEAPDLPRSPFDESFERYMALAERVAKEVFSAEANASLARRFGDLGASANTRPTGIVRIPAEDPRPLAIQPEDEPDELLEPAADERTPRGNGLAFS